MAQDVLSGFLEGYLGGRQQKLLERKQKLEGLASVAEQYAKMHERVGTRDDDAARMVKQKAYEGLVSTLEDYHKTAGEKFPRDVFTMIGGLLHGKGGDKDKEKGGGQSASEPPSVSLPGVERTSPAQPAMPMPQQSFTSEPSGPPPEQFGPQEFPGPQASFNLPALPGTATPGMPPVSVPPLYSPSPSGPQASVKARWPTAQEMYPTDPAQRQAQQEQQQKLQFGKTQYQAKLLGDELAEIAKGIVQYKDQAMAKNMSKEQVRADPTFQKMHKDYTDRRAALIINLPPDAQQEAAKQIPTADQSMKNWFIGWENLGTDLVKTTITDPVTKMAHEVNVTPALAASIEAAGERGWNELISYYTAITKKQPKDWDEKEKSFMDRNPHLAEMLGGGGRGSLRSDTDEAVDPKDGKTYLYNFKIKDWERNARGERVQVPPKEWSPDRPQRARKPLAGEYLDNTGGYKSAGLISLHPQALRGEVTYPTTEDLRHIIESGALVDDMEALKTYYRSIQNEARPWGTAR